MPNPEKRMADTEEHELPSIEAVLAATLALMTGYSQALQAATHPAQRLPIGAKIGANLALLAREPLLSNGFRHVLDNLLQCWAAMGECTEAAARDCVAATHAGDSSSSFTAWRTSTSERLH